MLPRNNNNLKKKKRRQEKDEGEGAADRAAAPLLPARGRGAGAVGMWRSSEQALICSSG